MYLFDLIMIFFQSQEWLGETKVKVGMKLEVVNKMCVSAMRVAAIKEVIGGRLRLNYADTGVSQCRYLHFMLS